MFFSEFQKIYFTPAQNYKQINTIYNVQIKYPQGKTVGARGNVVVKALCYKPEGRGSIPDEVNFFNLPNPSGRTRTWGLLSLQQKLSTGNIQIIIFLGSKVRQVNKADNFTAIYEPIV
jgi:hypothetical protein